MYQGCVSERADVDRHGLVLTNTRGTEDGMEGDRTADGSQRDKSVVRLDGIDTESGRHRPRQLGTYTSQRAARTAAAEFAAERAEGGSSGTAGWLVDRWVAAKNDITEKSQMQNRWAAGHIRKALGAIRLDQIDRSDIARWYDKLDAGGVLNKRSIRIIRRRPGRDREPRMLPRDRRHE